MPPGRPCLPTAIVLLVAALAAGCTSVALPPPAPVPHAIVNPLSPADRTFMNRIAANWLYESEVSRLVAGRPANPRVRAYAQSLAIEHAKAQGELHALMQSKGLAVPQRLTAEKAAKLQQLSALRPSQEFDLGYVRVLGVENHTTAIALFERAQREVRDRDVRAWVDRMLPVLRARLVTAQKLSGALSS